MLKTFIVVTLLALPMAAFAQLSVGVRGGYATSSYSYQATASNRSTSVDGIGTPTFALVVEYFNSKNAGIELNLQQLTLGFRQVNGEDELNQTDLTYLKMPLLASTVRHLGCFYSVWNAAPTHYGKVADLSDLFGVSRTMPRFIHIST
jgi:hypothetical protein